MLQSFILKILKYRIIRITFYSIMVVFSIFFIRGYQKNSQIDNLITQFKNDKIFDGEISNDQYYYYHVSRETFDDAFDDENLLYPGKEGDLLVSLESPFSQIPLLNEGFAFFFGGHAAVSYGKEIIDVTGNFLKTDINYVKKSKNDFLINSRLKSFIGLRVKDATENDFLLTKEFYESKIGDKYNYTFFFNRSSTFYCTDLIYQAWQQKQLSRQINLGLDGIIVSVQDLILSKDLELFMYKYVDNNQITHIYF